MAKAPDPLNLRADTISGVPDWALKVFQSIGRFADQTQQALSGGLTRGDNFQGTEKNNVTFTTEATAANTFPIKVQHGMSTTPKHVSANINTDPFSVITTAWSMNWRPSSGGQIEVYFQGLANSTKYIASFTFE